MIVSGITLQVSALESNKQLARITGWLRSHRFQPLVPLVKYYGVNRHPHMKVFGAEYNDFFESEFAEFVVHLPWLYPANVVLLINPEKGATRVWRASEFK